VCESLLAIINAICSSEVNIGSQIIEHNYAQLHTEMTAVLQLKLAYLVSGSCKFSCVISCSHPKWWAQLSLSPIPQFSPKSSPPNRDDPLYRKPLWATTLVRIPTNLCTESHYGLQLWWGFLSANGGSQLRRCYMNNWITTPLLHTYPPMKSHNAVK